MVSEVKIVPKLDESDFEYLKKNNGNYRDKIDNDIMTQEPVDGELGGTKNITGDEYANDQTRNNYWWSRSFGNGSVNCSIITTKAQLKETIEKHLKKDDPKFFHK